MTIPTDSEIAELRAQYGVTSNGRGVKEFTQVADFARAVLARWGAAPTGEPVAWLIDWPDEPELGHYFSESRSDAGRCTPLYTAPQPAEPPRVPLPEKQIWTIVNQQCSDMLDGKQEQISPITIGRAIEAAHGITHKEAGA